MPLQSPYLSDVSTHVLNVKYITSFFFRHSRLGTGHVFKFAFRQQCPSFWQQVYTSPSTHHYVTFVAFVFLDDDTQQPVCENGGRYSC